MAACGSLSFVRLCPAFTTLLIPLPTLKKRERGRSYSRPGDPLPPTSSHVGSMSSQGRWGDVHPAPPLGLSQGPALADGMGAEVTVPPGSRRPTRRHVVSASSSPSVARGHIGVGSALAWIGKGKTPEQSHRYAAGTETSLRDYKPLIVGAGYDSLS